MSTTTAVLRTVAVAIHLIAWAGSTKWLPTRTCMSNCSPIRGAAVAFLVQRM